MITDENKMVADNTNIVYAVIHRYFPKYSDDEDIFQVGMIGLLKAIRSFDENKGFKFSSLAYEVIHNEILRELKKANKKTNIPQELLISLDEQLQEDEINGDSSLYNKLYIEDYADYQCYIEEFKSRLKGKQLQIFEELLNGYTRQSDIAKKLGISRQAVSLSVIKIRNKFINTYFRGD